MNFFTTYGSDLLLKTGEHIYISAVALGLGILVAVPLGVLLTRTNKIASVVIGIASVLQTVPSLALRLLRDLRGKLLGIEQRQLFLV